MFDRIWMFLFERLIVPHLFAVIFDASDGRGKREYISIIYAGSLASCEKVATDIAARLGYRKLPSGRYATVGGEIVLTINGFNSNRYEAAIEDLMYRRAIVAGNHSKATL